MIYYNYCHANSTKTREGGDNDIYREREKEFIERHGDKLDADVVGIPHHGDGTSSSRDFIEAVDPDIALIASNNIYNMSVLKDIMIMEVIFTIVYLMGIYYLFPMVMRMV